MDLSMWPHPGEGLGAAPATPPGCGHMDKSIKNLPNGNTNRICTIPLITLGRISSFAPRQHEVKSTGLL